MAAVGGADLEALLSQVESQMRRSAENAASAQRAKAQAENQAQGAANGAQPSPQPGAPQANAAQSGCHANEAAQQKWSGFRPQDAAKDAAPKMPKVPKAASPSSPSSPEPAAAKPDAAPATSAASAASATSAASAARTTSAPSKLDKVLDKNPSIKTNQDLINHFYKNGGDTWEGASAQAKKAGVTMTELVRDRQGDARKTAASKRTGLAPSSSAPSSSAPSSSAPPSSAPSSSAPSSSAPSSSAPSSSAPSSSAQQAADARAARAAGPEKSGQQRGFKPFRPVDEQKLKDALPPQAKSLAKAFIDAGRKNNVDPVVLAAIAKHETGNFTSSAFRNKHNAMGVSGTGGPMRFANASQSIDKMAKLLGSSSGPYRNAHDIAQLARIYAPTRGATNDPGHLNNSWPAGVSRFADDLARRVRPDAARPLAA